MEELFQALSSSARIDKSKRPKKRKKVEEGVGKNEAATATTTNDDDKPTQIVQASRDRTGKRDAASLR